MSARSVAVIGTVNHDVIVTPDGRVRESLGGILYNAVPLAALLQGTGITVRLVGRLGSAHRELAARLLTPFPEIDVTGLIVDPAGTNESHLDYSAGGERVETVDLRVAELTEADVAAASAADAVLVNMISGRDLTVETAESLRAAGRGRMFLDVQALARTPDTPRRSRMVESADRWARAFHVVRGNEEEITHFGGRPGRLDDAADRLLEAGCQEVVVTRGAAGAVRFTREAGQVRRQDVDAVPCRHPVDPTGCGDSFLSGVVAAHLLGLSPTAGVRLAAFVASEVLAVSGLDALEGLRGVRERAAAALGPGP